MVPWYVTLPLRKAATIPVIGISFILFGSAYGSYDLTRKFIILTVPKTKTPPKRNWQTNLNFFFSFVLGSLTVATRERFFPPIIPKAPDLPIEGVPLETRIRNASAMAMVSNIDNDIYLRQRCRLRTKFFYFPCCCSVIYFLLFL